MKYIKKLLSVLLIITLAQLHCLANEVFNKANQYYQKGEYQKAIGAYESLCKQGFHSAELYFNLGNAYYKSNNTAAAILNLEKAHKLAPADEDIIFNLKMANLKVIDKISPLPELFYKRWWKDFATTKSANSWSVISIVLFWLCVAAAVLFIISINAFYKRIGFFSAVLLLLCSGITMALAAQQNNIEQTNNTAVIFSPSVYVKSSPNERSVDLFILHEGSKVFIIDAIGSWRRVRIANGSEGWIQGTHLEVI